MSSCQSRRLPAPLNDFQRKLLDLPHATLTPDERRWLRVFRRVQRKFSELTEENSFWISMFALLKCHAKGFERHLGYVQQACVREHVAALHCRKSRAKVRRPRPRPLSPNLPSPHRWDLVDARIDLADALDRLDGEHRRAVRMRRDGHTHADIAKVLGLSERQAIRVVKEAHRRLGEWLGESYWEAA